MKREERPLPTTGILNLEKFWYNKRLLSKNKNLQENIIQLKLENLKCNNSLNFIFMNKKSY